MIQLSRFTYDCELHHIVKLNNRVTFDRRLDMYPFTVTNIKEEEDTSDQQPAQIMIERGDYEYELMGIINHSGTANGGHYVAIINNDWNASGADGGTTNNWVVLDDSVVYDFDPDDEEQGFDAQCFTRVGK